jgi:hypothetical protein
MRVGWEPFSYDGRSLSHQGLRIGQGLAVRVGEEPGVVEMGKTGPNFTRVDADLKPMKAPRCEKSEQGVRQNLVVGMKQKLEQSVGCGHAAFSRLPSPPSGVRCVIL